MSAVRFWCKVLATPIFIFCFGIVWIGFLLFIGVGFQIFSFLLNERFDWKAHFAECNEFFMEPLVGMWGHKNK